MALSALFQFGTHNTSEWSLYRFREAQAGSAQNSVMRVVKSISSREWFRNWCLHGAYPLCASGIPFAGAHVLKLWYFVRSYLRVAPPQPPSEGTVGRWEPDGR
jgi:hypothetical protein